MIYPFLAELSFFSFLESLLLYLQALIRSDLSAKRADIAFSLAEMAFF